jgi:transposase
MLQFMDRATIHYLNQKGWSNVEIAEFVGHHRDTIARVLREPLDQQAAPRQRTSAVALFDAHIHSWLDQKWSVQRMLEVARSDPDHPYSGSSTAFYDYVRPIKRARKGLPGNVPVRFEGLPGELLQIDWGEVRLFPFTQPALAGQTRYFFAARLKYSRFMVVRFTTDMREETLLRCLIGAFLACGGVPWVVTSDNIKTITLGRDEANQPIWHPSFQKCAAEFSFLPAACTPMAANQKGAVENLVKFVKGNFLIGRSFYDDADLEHECLAWLYQVNHLRPSDATEKLPAQLLADEQVHFGPLPILAQDYGFFESVKVNRESLVSIATNRYSVPAHLVGCVLVARLHPTRIELFHGTERVATHARQFGRNTRLIVPEHFEAVFAHKPRARIMVYRDWLVGLSSLVAEYVAQLCRKRYAEMDTQVVALYQLAQQLGRTDFLAGVALAHEQQTFGAEYVQAVTARYATSLSATCSTELLAHYSSGVPQQLVERDLQLYEQYVANGAELNDLCVGGGV